MSPEPWRDKRWPYVVLEYILVDLGHRRFWQPCKVSETPILMSLLSDPHRRHFIINIAATAAHRTDASEEDLPCLASIRLQSATGLQRPSQSLSTIVLWAD